MNHRSRVFQYPGILFLKRVFISLWAPECHNARCLIADIFANGVSKKRILVATFREGSSSSRGKFHRSQPSVRDDVIEPRNPRRRIVLIDRWTFRFWKFCAATVECLSLFISLLSPVSFINSYVSIVSTPCGQNGRILDVNFPRSRFYPVVLLERFVLHTVRLG